MSYNNSIILPKKLFYKYKNKNSEKFQYINKINKNKKNYKFIGRILFKLLDGPPYANGEIHIGHVVNKLSKHIIILSYNKIGYRSKFNIGWDCHGLPIEIKVSKKLKKSTNSNYIRFYCRIYAFNWMKIQLNQFKYLGLNIKKIYSTMKFKSETKILIEFYKLVKKKCIYFGYKPITWSLSEKTCISENDIKYKDYEIHYAYIYNLIVKRKQYKYKVFNSFKNLLKININKTYKLLGNKIISIIKNLWMLPWSNAISLSFKKKYAIYLFNNKIVILNQLCKIKKTYFKISCIPLNIIKNILYYNIFDKNSYPIINTNFNNLSTKNININDLNLIDKFFKKNIYYLKYNFKSFMKNTYNNNTNKLKGILFVINKLLLMNMLIICKINVTKLPHSTRSNKLVISCILKQWYIKIGKSEKNIFLKHIKNILFSPQKYIRILYNLINSRPDWILSRQRYWGIPICLMLKNNKILWDNKINRKILKLVSLKGSGIWFNLKLLYNRYKKNSWHKIKDVLDVWFDSSQSYLLNNVKLPWNLVIEGIDQHRGWFQSTLINSVLLYNIIPFKVIKTHGFIMINNYNKMSKSKNAIWLRSILNKTNNNILRIWICNINIHTDQKIKKNWLIKPNYLYNKIENLLNWTIGLLDNNKKLNLEFKCLSPLDKFILHRLKIMSHRIKKLYFNQNLNKIINLINYFCDDISSLYFDAKKDILYCDPENSSRRISILSIIKCIIKQLILWLYPIIPLKLEEIKSKIKIYNNNIIILPDIWFIKKSNWIYIFHIKKWIQKLNSKKIFTLSKITFNLIIKKKNLLNMFNGINLSELFLCGKINIILNKKFKKKISITKNIHITFIKNKLIKCLRSRKFLFKNEINTKFNISIRDSISIKSIDKLYTI